MTISSREAMNALDATYPRLATLYDRMMTSARIFTPPKILVHPIESIGLASISTDTIVIDSHYVEHAPTGHTAAIIGHETGHLLSERRLTCYTPDHIIREFEQEADAIAVHLTGSHDDVSTMRQESNRYVSNSWRPSNKLGLKEGSLLERIAQKLDHLSPCHKKRGDKLWAAHLRYYGTPKELEANIRRVDLSDRSHVDRLIALRNAVTNPTQNLG